MVGPFAPCLSSARQGEHARGSGFRVKGVYGAFCWHTLECKSELHPKGLRVNAIAHAKLPRLSSCSPPRPIM